jgi:hypothetical protein
MRPIDFYFDFASPYGFIAAMQIDRLARPVRWRPFLLGSIYKAVGQSALEHPLKREYVIEVDAPRMARRLGLQLKVPAGFPEHSLPPARAFYWIERQQPTKAIEFAKAAYRDIGCMAARPAMPRWPSTLRFRSATTVKLCPRACRNVKSKAGSSWRTKKLSAAVFSDRPSSLLRASDSGEATGCPCCRPTPRQHRKHLRDAH